MAAEADYLIPSLIRDGDYILAIFELKESVSGFSKLGVAALSVRLDGLLDVLRYRLDHPLSENRNAILENPIVALRAAKIACELAKMVGKQDPEQGHILNKLRRDLLLGVAGITDDLVEEDIRRCARDSVDLIYCLLGALSDAAASAPEDEKQNALGSYSKASRIVFS